MNFKTPSSLKKGHEKLHDMLRNATQVSGKTSEGEKKVAELMHPHFLKEEEYALPPLGLLPQLSSGKLTEEMKKVLPMTDKLKTELPEMLAEHKQIVAALEVLVKHGVTEQVVLREKIEESEAKLKEVQSLLHISNWEVDLVNGISTCSDEFFTMMEMSRDEIEPSLQAFLQLIHPEDFIFIKGILEKTYQTLEAGSFGARVKKRNGNIIYIYCEWKFEFDENSKPIRLYGIVQDISEKKMAELERCQIKDDLLQRNRDLEQFTFIVSHNLRAPTANIIGFTEYLQDETLTQKEQKDFLHGLASSVSSLDTIIKDINSILQVKLEVNEKRELISFSKLVDEIIISYGSLVDKHHFHVKSNFSEVDEIFSRRVYLHSIFYNLISNSIKYSRADEKPLIEIKSKKEKGKIILTFKDNGLGIDLKTKADKVFSLYSRFHSHVEGKGMGLFMVKTQVEAIGGKITVASELNKGTEFTIIFEN